MKHIDNYQNKKFVFINILHPLKFFNQIISSKNLRKEFKKSHREQFANAYVLTKLLQFYKNYKKQNLQQHIKIYMFVLNLKSLIYSINSPLIM